jgi:hypothetical protein
MVMTAYSMENPVFAAYAIAAAIMVLKVMGQGWMTVYRMAKSEAGLLNPEDLIPGPFNRNPAPEQLQPNDYVERSRRMHLNDLENIPGFLAAGLLFVAADPSVLVGEHPDDDVRCRAPPPYARIRDRPASRSSRHAVHRRFTGGGFHGRLPLDHCHILQVIGLDEDLPPDTSLEGLRAAS